MKLALFLRRCSALAAAFLVSFVTPTSQAVPTVVFADNFNRANSTIIGATAGPGTGTWEETQTSFTGTPNGDLLISNDLLLVDHNTVDSIYSLSMESTGFLAPWNNVLKDNPGKVTWTLNMQSSRPNLTGFISSTTGAIQDGIGVALISNGSTVGATQGYGLFWGGTGTGGLDPLALLSFNGLASTQILTASIAPFSNVGTNYLSIRVEYDPADDSWTLFARDDGPTGFSDPAITTGYVNLGSVFDADHTSLTMSHVGMFGSYTSNGATDLYRYDNFAISVDSPQPGDYNDDGIVDAADYVRWRDGLAPPHSPLDSQDYQLWRQNFGAGAGSGAVANSVPEPATWALALATLFCLSLILKQVRGSLPDRIDLALHFNE